MVLYGRERELRDTPVRQGRTRVAGPLCEILGQHYVQDEGQGISGDAVSQVFRRFCRVDKPDRRRIKGTRLGLAMFCRGCERGMGLASRCVVVTLKDLDPAESLSLQKAGVTALLRKWPGIAETDANLITKSLVSELVAS